MQNQLVSTVEHRIRPAARHILTIGKGIIKDNLTAIGELIKNSYDADADKVTLTFEKLKPKLSSKEIKNLLIERYPEKDEEQIKNQIESIFKINDELDSSLEDSTIRYIWEHGKEKFKLILVDNGTGMSTDTILNNWLVPSTNNKLKKQKTNKGRNVQGRKGIGRYAASILGNDFVCETIDEIKGIKSTIIINWKDFESDKYEYLDQVPILVESLQDDKKNHGTNIEIETLYNWNDIEIKKLIENLERLFLVPILETKDKFEIKLLFKNFIAKIDSKELSDCKIEPSAILSKAFHYKICGKVELVKSAIVASYTYTNSLDGISESESVKTIYEVPIKDYCGKIKFDLRVFDQDDVGIEALKKQYNEFISYSNKDVRRLLEKAEGISIYRNSFKIRPYGDNSAFDWLGLNARRINQPSRRLGTNQINGLIEIENEESSGLIEKASREGLKENDKFETLRKILLSIIVELENERNRYRDGSGKRIKNLQSSDEIIQKTFDFTNLYRKVELELRKAEVSLNVINDVANVIRVVEEDKHIQVAQINNSFAKQEEQFKNTIATFQVQATLGKIINVVLHEGRNPLSYLKEQSQNLTTWSKKLDRDIKGRLLIHDTIISELLDKIVSRTMGVKEQANTLLTLFSKLDSISITKRSKKREFNLVLSIQKAIGIFEGQLLDNNITFLIDSSPNVQLNGWEFDIVASFTNLIENSIYWLSFSNREVKEIIIKVTELDDEISILYQDNGIGIEESHIEDQRIFEPGFTTKSGGTGLGLAIAGEALERNGGTLSAVYNTLGAEFHIHLKK